MGLCRSLWRPQCPRTLRPVWVRGQWALGLGWRRTRQTRPPVWPSVAAGHTRPALGNHHEFSGLRRTGRSQRPAHRIRDPVWPGAGEETHVPSGFRSPRGWTTWRLCLRRERCWDILQFTHNRSPSSGLPTSLSPGPLGRHHAAQHPRASPGNGSYGDSTREPACPPTRGSCHEKSYQFLDVKMVGASLANTLPICVHLASFPASPWPGSSLWPQRHRMKPRQPRPHSLALHGLHLTPGPEECE